MSHLLDKHSFLNVNFTHPKIELLLLSQMNLNLSELRNLQFNQNLYFLKDSHL